MYSEKALEGHIFIYQKLSVYPKKKVINGKPQSRDIAQNNWSVLLRTGSVTARKAGGEVHATQDLHVDGGVEKAAFRRANHVSVTSPHHTEDRSVNSLVTWKTNRVQG